MLLWHWACLPVSSVTRHWGYFSAPPPDATCVRSARAAECVPHSSLRKRLITPGIFHMPLWAIFAPHTVSSWRGSAFSWWNDPEWSTSLVKPYQVIQCEHKEMLMVVADLFVGWLSFQDAFSLAHVFLKSPKVKRAQLASKQLKEKCRFYQLKKQRVPKSPPPKYFPWAQILTTWFLQEMSVCLCGLTAKCVSDLYMAAWKDLNSCKQHCSRCPICFHVPLVWMPFCHFFHSLPSGCLRTSNPEKRAHLPKEERSKLDFRASLLTWARQRNEIQ